MGTRQSAGRTGDPAQAEPSWDPGWNIVTPAYFDVMRIPLVKGRAFTEQDRTGAPDVAIIDETLASRVWPNEDAVGKSFRNEERTSRSSASRATPSTATSATATMGSSMSRLPSDITKECRSSCDPRRASR
jgi:hypothetical protein